MSQDDTPYAAEELPVATLYEHANTAAADAIRWRDTAPIMAAMRAADAERLRGIARSLGHAPKPVELSKPWSLIRREYLALVHGYRDDTFQFILDDRHDGFFYASIYRGDSLYPFKEPIWRADNLTEARDWFNDTFNAARKARGEGLLVQVPGGFALLYTGLNKKPLKV
jgi:hypothetical protein